jgi:hypothetical protein
LNGYTAGIARIPTGITVAATALSGTNGLTNILYIPKGTTGGCIIWWDFGATTPVAKPIYAGDAVGTNLTTTCT